MLIESRRGGEGRILEKKNSLGELAAKWNRSEAQSSSCSFGRCRLCESVYHRGHRENQKVKSHRTVMSEVDLTQRLDEAIDAMIATGELPSGVDERIADLLGVAIELRKLPRFEFRERLRTELEEEIRMSTAAKPTKQNINPVREGFRTITPYLIVSDVHAEAEFLKQAFGVTGHIYGLGSQ